MNHAIDFINKIFLWTLHKARNKTYVIFEILARFQNGYDTVIFVAATPN